MIFARQPMLLFTNLIVLFLILGCSKIDEVGEVATLSLTIAPESIAADNTSEAVVTILAKDSLDANINGAKIELTKTLGKWTTDVNSVTTVSNGSATIKITSDTVGESTIIATSGGQNATGKVTFTEPPPDQNALVANISLKTSFNKMDVENATTVAIKVRVIDGAENPLKGATVQFESTHGDLTASSRVTNEEGYAIVGLNANTEGMADIKVLVGGFQATGQVDFIKNANDNVATIQFIATVERALANGTESVTLEVTAFDSGNNGLEDVTVNFSTSLGSLSDALASTGSTGKASIQLNSTEIGSADITVSVNEFSETVTVNFIGEEAPPVIASAMSLSLSKLTVASSGAETAEVTATLLDQNNAVLSGGIVRFSVDGGQLSLSSAVSDENGEASVIFSSGTQNPSNRIATITVRTGAQERQIPVQIIGSSIDIESSVTSMILGSGTAGDDQQVLILMAKDSNADPVFETNITVSISGGSGAATLSSSGGLTDINGRLPVMITGTTAGTVNVTATALGDSVTKTFTINQVTEALQITSPAANTAELDIGVGQLTIEVTAPNSSQLTFVTSLGQLTGSDGSTTGQRIKQVVTDNKAQVALASAVGGVATVEVFDSANSTTIDRLIVFIAAPAVEARNIIIQANRNVLPLSTSDINYEAKIIASVTNKDDFPVRNAAVFFKIDGATGGGEFLSPIYGLTGPNGKIETTFTSGTISSDQKGILVSAYFIDTNSGLHEDAISVVIGGTAGSVVIGSSTTMTSVSQDTAYSMPMSVLVADSNGNPIAGTTVSLSIWPLGYYQGFWQEVYGQNGELLRCDPIKTSSLIPNEDRNENLMLDKGEDLNCNGALEVGEDLNNDGVLDIGEDANCDGLLTPESSAAGTSPQILMTDEKGIATFDLVYLKHYAPWIENRIRASTMVQGTETTTVLNLNLNYLLEDAKTCALPNSPFGAGSLVGEIQVVAIPDEGVADGATPMSLRATVLNSEGQVLPNVSVDFNTSAGALNSEFDVTNNNGLAAVNLTSATVGEVLVTVSAGTVKETISVSFSTEAIPVIASAMSLSASKLTVASNNAETAQVTATLLDQNNAVLPGGVVNFSADGGQLSLSSVVSNENGQATISFSSGTKNPANRIVTITATTGVLDTQIPIQVVGSTVTIESSTNSVILESSIPDADKQTLTIVTKNSNGDAVYNTDIALSISGGTGSATLSSETGRTDVNGKLSIVLTGTVAGTVDVTAVALGATATQTFTVDQLTAAFQITSPSTDIVGMDTGVNSEDGLSITVTAPGSSRVTFVTSLGEFGGVTGQQKVDITVDESNNATVALRSTQGGIATVEVFDALNPTVIDRIRIAVSSPSSAASKITIQADRNILPLSVGDISYEAKITASVTDVNDFPVNGAAVFFRINDATGGSEFLSPIYGLTGVDGKIGTTFTSGSISSDQKGVLVSAYFVDTVGGIVDEDSIALVIGGTAGSVVIGRSTNLSTLNSDTAYSQPMSVLVADSNGNPIAGTTVSLSVWPKGYYKGYWKALLGESTNCTPRFNSGLFFNEDVNENLVLDLGEDTNGDNLLTPGNSAGGILPQTLVTDENGLATFDLVYLKNYAPWVISRIRASTLVQGTETTSVFEKRLSYTSADAKACVLSSSPFGTGVIVRSMNGDSLLNAGDTLVFVADGGTEPYAWSTSDNSIATIDSATGLLIGVGVGSVLVTVTDDNGITANSGTITIE